MFRLHGVLADGIPGSIWQRPTSTSRLSRMAHGAVYGSRFRDSTASKTRLTFFAGWAIVLTISLLPSANARYEPNRLRYRLRDRSTALRGTASGRANANTPPLTGPQMERSSMKISSRSSGPNLMVQRKNSTTKYRTTSTPTISPVENSTGNEKPPTECPPGKARIARDSLAARP